MYHKLYCENKQHLRRRSPDNVIEELLYAKKRGEARLIVFVDDVFIQDKYWLEDFIEKYKSKINIPFYCTVHPLLITRGKALLLKEGGCCLVGMGIQSGSERIRREIFHRMGSNEKIVESVSRLKEVGITVSVDNIFGAPTETESDLKESLDLYNRIKADNIWTFWLTFYPKTDIIDYAKDRNILSAKDIENIEKGYVGYAHDTGSVPAGKIDTYARFELLFRLRSFIHCDKLYFFLCKFVMFFPFKRAASKIILLLTALKNRDDKSLYTLRLIWAKKNTP